MPFANVALTWSEYRSSRGTMAPKGKNLAVCHSRSLARSCPEALGSPTGCVVRPGHRLLWPHPSHSPSSHGLFASSVRHSGGEWVPTLSGVSVRACHPQYPDGSVGCIRLLLPRQRWSWPNLQRLDIHKPHARWYSRGLRHEADSGSLALRPARWLALHQQGHLQPSFRRSGHPEPTSVMTTQANSQLLWPDSHRQDTQPYGLRTDFADDLARPRFAWPQPNRKNAV
jgi:hypothetical protein